jgi:NNP family nitrate/nitrite transporter-like MFS transporter
MVVSLTLFALLAKDAPNAPAPKPLADYLRVIKNREALWFCGFYAVTFGGFVGLASFLNTFFVDQYEMKPVHAGYFATVCVIAGSVLRPVGGYLADRFGGVAMLRVLYFGVGLAIFGVALLPHVYLATALLAVGMGMLGMGNGAVFQLVPQRFAREIGVLTGLVGAAGGIGGFFLPLGLGGLKQATGTFAAGFALFALVGMLSSAAIWSVGRAWIRGAALEPLAA